MALNHYLESMFNPRSVAVVGASEREGSLAGQVFRNIIDAGFSGPLYPVNRKGGSVFGREVVTTLEAIGKPVDLVVVATPAATVIDIIESAGRVGIRNALVLSAGFGEGEFNVRGKRRERQLLEVVREHDMRLIGPNCLGIIRPCGGLNATFCKNRAMEGNLALISQSGAICTAILDWAESEQIGFSTVASLGDAVDIDFGDVLDYLAVDPRTTGILMYVEGIKEARRFMSGLRAAARMKPVVVIKSGRHAEGSRAAMSHTGALVGSDDVFDAALERAGVVRASTVSQLFAAARLLSHGTRINGNAVALITNAGGPGVMATDRAIDLGVKVPELAPSTLQALDAALPPHWSKGNPVDVLGDAGVDRYRAALEACLNDPGVNAAIVMLTPQAMTQPLEIATAVTDLAAHSTKPVIACWMGQNQVQAGRDHFDAHRIANFTTPEAAVEAVSYLAMHQRNQRLLLQTPSPRSQREEPDVAGARLIIQGALAEGRKVLGTMESKAILSAFRIPVNQTLQAGTPSEALIAAGTVGYPVAMKIDSPDISHKSDVNGVRLNIGSAEAVRSAFRAMVDEARERRPDARIRGVTVEAMRNSRHARELMLGVVSDPAFGPAISFGAGGTAVEILNDRAIALPPLNDVIIESMISRTRVARLLGAFRQMPAIDRAALRNVLSRLSDMVCELPEIEELDINPMIADEHGLQAVDARISVRHPSAGQERYGHMAIHPYPGHLIERWQLPDGTDVTIRPIRPEDAEIEKRFVEALSERTRYFRFMQSVYQLTPQMLVRFTQIDYDREMALVAIIRDRQGEDEQIAVARYTANPDQQGCEFALVVADAWQGHGIGARMMTSLMNAARSKGLRKMQGDVLANNAGMMRLMERLGFSIAPSNYSDDIRSVLKRL